MSYQQHEDLCEKTILAEKEVEAERIRKEGLNNICPYVDCSLSESQSLCPNQCDRRKLSKFFISCTNQLISTRQLFTLKFRSTIKCNFFQAIAVQQGFGSTRQILEVTLLLRITHKTYLVHEFCTILRVTIFCKYYIKRMIYFLIDQGV